MSKKSRTPSLKEQTRANDEAFEKTGHLFGLEASGAQGERPGHLRGRLAHPLEPLQRGLGRSAARSPRSPIAAEGGDALWSLHLPTGEAICISRGISAHAGLLADMIKNFIDLGYEDNPGFKQGDIFENNDPHYGGIHSPDFDMCMPLFYERRADRLGVLRVAT